MPVFCHDEDKTLVSDDKSMKGRQCFRRVMRESRMSKEFLSLYKILKMHDSKMGFRGILLLFLAFEGATALLYEESISDLLVQCNSYQKQINFKNRTAHSCEKEDPDGDFRYFITPMKTDYSKRDFLCVLFFKNSYSKLNFKFLFTHPNFTVDAVRKPSN